MKVTIEFNDYEGENPVDLESTFDAISFSTPQAEEVEDWASAVIVFAKTCGRFDTHKIVQNACFLEGGYLVKDWDYLVGLLCDTSRAKLRAALDCIDAGGSGDSSEPAAFLLAASEDNRKKAGASEGTEKAYYRAMSDALHCLYQQATVEKWTRRTP